jgi:hypothetical protein
MDAMYSENVNGAPIPIAVTSEDSAYEDIGENQDRAEISASEQADLSGIESSLQRQSSHNLFVSPESLVDHTSRQSKYIIILSKFVVKRKIL